MIALVLLSSFVFGTLLPIHPVNAQTFARIGALSMDPGVWLSSAILDSAAGFAYFGLVPNTSGPGSVVKIRLSDFTVVGKLRLDPGESPAVSVIDVAAGFAYFATSSDIVKIRLSDFTRVGALVLNPGESAGTFVIDTASGFAYLGTWTDPGLIVKVRLSDLTRVGALTLNSGERYLTSGVIDPSTGLAYFGTDGGPIEATSPGIIVRFKLSNFTRVGSITLNANEYNLRSALLDSVRGFAYFSSGGCTHPPPWQNYQACAFSGVVKVRLSDFGRVGAFSLNPNEDWPTSLVIDSASGFLYIGTRYIAANSWTGDVVKVRLSDFARVGALALNPSEDWLAPAVFDSSSGYAYFGTLGFPSEVIKVEVAPPIILYHPPSLLDQFVWWAPYLSIATGIGIMVGVIIIQIKGRRHLRKLRLTDVWSSASFQFRSCVGLLDIISPGLSTARRQFPAVCSVISDR